MTTKMSRADELKLVKSALSLVNDDSQIDEIAKWYDGNVSESLKLELQGASWDAMGNLLPTKEGKLPSMYPKINRNMIGLLMAGMLRCMGNSCEHARCGPRGSAISVFLAPRVVSCSKCILSFVDLMREHDRNKQNADECDFCLKRGVVTFYQFHCSYGGFNYYGDACDDCIALARKGG